MSLRSGLPLVYYFALCVKDLKRRSRKRIAVLVDLQYLYLGLLIRHLDLGHALVCYRELHVCRKLVAVRRLRLAQDVSLPRLELALYVLCTRAARKRVDSYVLFLVDNEKLRSNKRLVVLIDLKDPYLCLGILDRDKVYGLSSARYRSVRADRKLYLVFVKSVSRGRLDLLQVERSRRKLVDRHVSVGLPLVHYSSQRVYYLHHRAVEEFSSRIHLYESGGVRYARIRERYRDFLSLVDRLKLCRQIRHIRAVPSALRHYQMLLLCVCHGVRRSVYVLLLCYTVGASDWQLIERYALPASQLDRELYLPGYRRGKAVSVSVGIRYVRLEAVKLYVEREQLVGRCSLAELLLYCEAARLVVLRLRIRKARYCRLVLHDIARVAFLYEREALRRRLRHDVMRSCRDLRYRDALAVCKREARLSVSEYTSAEVYGACCYLLSAKSYREVVLSALVLAYLDAFGKLDCLCDFQASELGLRFRLRFRLRLGLWILVVFKRDYRRIGDIRRKRRFYISVYGNAVALGVRLRYRVSDPELAPDALFRLPPRLVPIQPQMDRPDRRVFL